MAQDPTDATDDKPALVQLMALYHQGPLLLTLIPAWIINHMPSKVWDEITYPFLNFNGATVEV